MADNRHIVCRVDDLVEGKGESFVVQGQRVAVFKVDGEFFALEDRCSHANAPLAGGYVHVREKFVICPWCGAEFDLKTGGVLAPPACEDIQAYSLLIEGSELSIELPM